MLLYKYRSLEHLEYVLDILLNERLYCPEYRHLNDPFEGMFFSLLPSPIHFPEWRSKFSDPYAKRRMALSVTELVNQVGATRVCSLSSTATDPRMWSLYASGLSGLAIEIDFSGVESDISRVLYSPAIPEFGNTLLTAPAELEVLRHKTEHWAYEQEYRIITSNEFYSVVGRIKSVLVGQRMPSARLELLLRIVDGRIPIKLTVLDYEAVQIRA